MTLNNLFKKGSECELAEKQRIIASFSNRKICASVVDSIKSTIKETFPDLAWCYTRTKKELIQDDRDLFIWFAIGGKVREKALIFCFKVQEQVITDITVRDERVL